MTGYIIVGVLAAFGAYSLVWTLFGWLLPSGQGCALVCFGQPDEGVLTRFWWLRGTGLLRCPLLAVVPEETELPVLAEKCSGEALLARLKWERNQVHGTGNGDPAGCDPCSGISEL